MLRRKLLLILFGLTGVFMVMAVCALLGLQAIFVELDHINDQAGVLVQQTNALNTTISAIEVELYSIQSGRQRHLDDLIELVDSAQGHVKSVGEHYALSDSPGAQAYNQLTELMPVFKRHVAALATSQDPETAIEHNLAAITMAAKLRGATLAITRHAQDHMQAEQAALTRHFRWLVVGIALGFLLVLNLSIIMLLRAAGMILRPVEQLVLASRRLAEEDFDHRVQVTQHDEFEELASAYNRLAGQLQENEQRKIEMLGQVALTLNHELNNAIAVIDLQLRLIGRRSGGDGKFEQQLRQIQGTLERMTHVVESLKHIRRVVLTDYAVGMKMLDLEQSTREDTSALPATAAAHAEDHA